MRVPIADRPEAVGSRKGFGHFESDTVVGAAPSRRCMNTQVERRSRRLFARLVDDKSASATASVLLQCLFDRFGSVFPQCGLMVFPGVVIVSR